MKAKLKENVMIEKELREIKRRFRPDKNNIPRIVGCFVNENKEIIAKISQTVGTSDSVVTEKLLSVMKKVLSGSIGTNLTNVPFSTKQVTDSDEHKLLMRLRNSELKDQDALGEFYAKIIESVKLDSNYVILLAEDAYDVFKRGPEGEAAESTETFTYVICAVCPIKVSGEGICFRESDSLFHNVAANSLLTSPELGFMFPAFDDRRTNIYSALYYTRNIGNNYPEFAERILGFGAPMPPKEQKRSFDECIIEALGEECSLSTVRSIHTQVSEMIESHKDTKVEEPLTLSKATISAVLENCGVDEKKVQSFGEKFDEQFGKNAEVAPKNIVEVKKYELTTPDVTIKVNPEHRELVTTETINGVKYILVRATEGVQVNGINIKFEND